jgi:imidazolonepropionase-like amidohydrolase
MSARRLASALSLALSMAAFQPTTALEAQVAVRARKLYTMAGPPIDDGAVIIREGKVAAVGKAADLIIPPGFRLLEAEVATPGLIDARSVAGLSGHLNISHDQDQIERSSPLQPELRAIDAYNPRELLVDWLRGLGVTTLHTGHAPGELISGQTMIVKTAGRTVEEALVTPAFAVAATIGPQAAKEGGRSPGTRGKMMAMLRARLLEARSYLERQAAGDPEKRPARDLGLEALGRVLRRELPLLITAHRAQDIDSALRLAREFELRIILNGAAEAYLLLEEIKAAGVPVILHAPMARMSGELENASFETAALLRRAGILFALESGYESYVPKTRVVLFEAAIAAAHGLSFEEALAAITIDAARILGIDARAGSLAIGKDGDVALFDGDPFEYTSRSTATIIEGRVVSEGRERRF